MVYHIVKKDTDGLTYFLADRSITDEWWVLKLNKSFRYFDKRAAERKSQSLRGSWVVPSREARTIDEENENRVIANDE